MQHHTSLPTLQVSRPQSDGGTTTLEMPSSVSPLPQRARSTISHLHWQQQQLEKRSMPDLKNRPSQSSLRSARMCITLSSSQSSKSLETLHPWGETEEYTYNPYSADTSREFEMESPQVKTPETGSDRDTTTSSLFRRARRVRDLEAGWLTERDALLGRHRCCGVRDYGTASFQGHSKYCSMRRECIVCDVMHAVMLSLQCTITLAVLGALLWVTVWHKGTSDPDFWDWLWRYAGPSLAVVVLLNFTTLLVHETRGLSPVSLLYLQALILTLTTLATGALSLRSFGQESGAVKGALAGLSLTMWVMAVMGFGRMVMIWKVDPTEDSAKY